MYLEVVVGRQDGDSISQQLVIENMLGNARKQHFLARSSLLLGCQCTFLHCWCVLHDIICDIREVAAIRMKIGHYYYYCMPSLTAVKTKGTLSARLSL